ncbi:trigger factor, partial [Catenibacterium sp.]|uniref:trigger factor n=1 Tax=Catenibacterium sp. TaxID=2049022 RepID=UPI003FD7B5DE
IGAKALREQAVEEILSENYAKIFVDNNVTPVAQPTANIVKSTETELEVTFTCPVKPEFELGEYKGLEVKKAQVRVTKKDVEERLNDYQKQFAELVVKEEGIQLLSIMKVSKMVLLLKAEKQKTIHLKSVLTHSSLDLKKV